MIKHIVMWKFHEEAEGRTKLENARLMKQKLEALVGVVPQIRFLEVGVNEKESEMAYDAVLISEFDSYEDLAAYKIHPEHQKVSEFCKKVRESRRFVDYQF